ncbi:hypothetical protein C8R44DRAFT_581362, partial [Mycena epipterygia]
LGTALEVRFQQKGDPEDLNETIELQREALALCPPPHTNHRGGSLNNLATAVQIRFQQRGDSRYIDKAIELHREALALCLPPHPDR